MSSPSSSPILGVDCVGDSCARWGGLVVALIGESGASDTAAAAAVGVTRQRIGGHAKQCPAFAAKLAEARERRRDTRRALADRREGDAVIELLAGGATLAAAAESVGVSLSTIYNWRWRSASGSFETRCRRAIELGRAVRARGG